MIDTISIRLFSNNPPDISQKGWLVNKFDTDKYTGILYKRRLENVSIHYDKREYHIPKSNAIREKIKNAHPNSPYFITFTGSLYKYAKTKGLQMRSFDYTDTNLELQREHLNILLSEIKEIVFNYQEYEIYRVDYCFHKKVTNFILFVRDFFYYQQLIKRINIKTRRIIYDTYYLWVYF